MSDNVQDDLQSDISKLQEWLHDYPEKLANVRVTISDSNKKLAQFQADYILNPSQPTKRDVTRHTNLLSKAKETESELITLNAAVAAKLAILQVDERRLALAEKAKKKQNLVTHVQKHYDSNLEALQKAYINFICSYGIINKIPIMMLDSHGLNSKINQLSTTVLKTEINEQLNEWRDQFDLHGVI